jgi:hypothetical protein
MDLQAAVAFQAAAEASAGRAAADLAGSVAEVPAEVEPAGVGKTILDFGF